MGLRYRSGATCTGRITESDRAREPRSLAVIALYDGWAQSQGFPPATYSRKLDQFEIDSWREGWTEGRAATAAWSVGRRDSTPNETESEIYAPVDV